jgi:hypothetical protein
MKRIKYSLYFLSVLGFMGLTSCDENDVDQNYGLTKDKPEISVATPTVTIDENGDNSSATFSVTASKAFSSEMKLRLRFLPDESIALDDTPLDFGPSGYLITIPANTTSASFNISAVFDILPEGVETLKFALEPVGAMNSVVTENSQIITVNINNSTDDSLVVRFDWESDKEYLGVDNAFHSYGDFDFDLEIYDATFDIVATSYSSVPEEVELPAADLPDGMYFIVPSLWTISSGETPMLPLTFNTTLTVAKPGVFLHNIELNGVWNSTDGGNEEGNPDAYALVAYFIKTTVDGEAMYELYDANDDTLLAQGRMADLSMAFGKNKAKKVKAKAIK